MSVSGLAHPQASKREHPKRKQTVGWMRVGFLFMRARSSARTPLLRDSHSFSLQDGVVEMIAKEISEVDSNSTVTVEYEDECPNFVGVALYKGGEVVDQEMFEWDEIKNKLNEIPELAEHWNEEEEDWSDEGRDIMSEYLWETTREMQEYSLQNMLTSIE